MAKAATRLVDQILPTVPVRQWVVSLPFGLRYRMAFDAALTTEVLRLFIRTVFASLRRRARRQGACGRLQCGAVTFIQRAGDALNLNPSRLRPFARRVGSPMFLVRGEDGLLTGLGSERPATQKGRNMRWRA